ncbi:MAG: hypothetical protein KF851_09915 [Pirellulaceae bacterium]|nr:hypothetical protein [Pirellulaceae bacterium]
MDPLIAAIILLVLGLLFIVLELFVPSAGILGILAGVCLTAGIVVGFIHSLMTGVIMLLVVVLALPIVFALMIKIWPSTPIGRRILVKPPTKEEVLPTGAHLDELRETVGKVAVAKTKMLPSGIVTIDRRQYDAVCEGFAVEPGDQVKVVAARSGRLYVQPYDPNEDLATKFGDANLLDKSLDELGIDSLEEPR